MSLSLTQNVGSIDRIFRVGLGAALIAPFAAKTAGVEVPSPLDALATIWAVPFGVIFLATGFLSWCPIYQAAGLSTAAKDEKKTA